MKKKCFIQFSTLGSVLGSPLPVLGMVRWNRGERNFVICEDKPINNDIIENVSSGAIAIVMVIPWGILNIHSSSVLPSRYKRFVYTNKIIC